MSLLAFKGRPWVAFDAHNREHRKWYAEFVRTGRWGRVPVRFICPEDQGDVVTMIQRRLVSYYADREFGKNNP